MSKDNTHLPVASNKRPNVPIETMTIGEMFRRIESGEAKTKPDADFNSLQRSIRKKGELALNKG